MERGGSFVNSANLPLKKYESEKSEYENMNQLKKGVLKKKLKERTQEYSFQCLRCVSGRRVLDFEKCRCHPPYLYIAQSI